MIRNPFSKLARNDPCWCGSTKKYKRCHLDRKSEASATMQDFITNFRKSFGAKLCLYPDTSKCRGEIVKAHSVQKALLHKISRNGKVYNFKAGVDVLASTGGVPEAKLIGLNDASTFTGFCAHHDNGIFVPLEKEEFVFSNLQIFLLHYRAICRELFTKKASLDANKKLKDFGDRGIDVVNQMFHQFFLDEQIRATEVGLRDAEALKSQADEKLMDDDFSEMRYCAIEFDHLPEFCCSGAFFPDYDLEGNLIQDLSDFDRQLEQISFSVFPTTTGGALIFGWMGESKACETFIASFLKTDSNVIGKLAAKFAFDCFENIFISPDWWDELDDKVNKAIVERILENANLAINKKAEYLTEEWVEFPISWNVTKITKMY